MTTKKTTKKKSKQSNNVSLNNCNFTVEDTKGEYTDILRDAVKGLNEAIKGLNGAVEFFKAKQVKFDAMVIIKSNEIETTGKKNN